MPQFNYRAGRAVAAATLLGAFLSTAPLQAGQAQQAAPQPQAAMPAPSATAAAKHKADRSEQRIKALHDNLRITADQEALWGTVAQAMRDNMQAMRATGTDRATRLKTMNAVEDLQSYQAVANQHAEGLKRLVPAFQSLYASMTPAQQKHADQVFGARQHHARG
jgi:periplasmic protein CpxP/Spy